jgi:hypothetical protein
MAVEIAIGAFGEAKRPMHIDPEAWAGGDVGLQGHLHFAHAILEQRPETSAPGIIADSSARAESRHTRGQTRAPLIEFRTGARNRRFAAIC